jgi:SAM-dependent methyltransferase
MLAVGVERAAKRGIDGLVWTEANAETLQFPDRFFDAYTIAFGIRNVTDIPKALREAHRVLKRGGRFFVLEFSTTQWPGFAEVYDAYSHRLVPKLGQLLAQDAGKLPLSHRIDPSLPRHADVRADDRRGRLRPDACRAPCSAGWWRSTAAGRFDPPVTASAPVHLFRLLKWGRILARHGALTGIERDPNTPQAGAPPGTRRAVRRARARRAALCRRLPGDRPRRDQARPDACHAARPGRRGRGARTCCDFRTPCPPSPSR